MLESTAQQTAQAFDVPLGTLRCLLATNGGPIPHTSVHGRSGRPTHSLNAEAQQLVALFAAIRLAGGRADDAVAPIYHLRGLPSKDWPRAMREGVMVRWQKKSSRLDFLPHRDFVPVVPGVEPEVFSLQDLFDAWQEAE